MSDLQQVAGVLIALGLGLVLVGVLLWFGGLGWFGNLPGDVRIERETFRLYLPISSMLLVSVVLSLLLYLARRLLG